ncbi:MAG: hypothetical protein CMF61_00925 [Magnetococcales bacterium]|nr:hypothetical protein [Magnetococcales bacterium]
MELKRLSAIFFTTLACGVSFSAFAQENAVSQTREIMPENTQKSILMPNLAVNFQLNSTLGEKETEYYARVVEKILNSLPKKLVLEGDERHLLSGSNKFDTLKVVAYLPAQGEERSDDPFNKIAKTYNIEFELPREKKLERLAKAGDEKPSIVEVQEGLDSFLNRVNGELSVDESSESDVSKTQEVGQLSAVDTAAVVEKTEKVSTAQNILREVNLNYYDNEVAFGLGQMDVFKKFAQSVKSSKVQKMRLVAQTASSPFSSWEEVQGNRIKNIMRLLKDEGVDVGAIEFSFIKMKSNFKQSIQINF